MNSPLLERTLTDLDHTRLSKLARARASETLPEEILAPLQDLLTDAHIVPSREVDGHIVTMYAQFVMRLNGSAVAQKLVLCYPDDAEPTKGFVSVLSPMGMALLGLGTGQMAHWQSPTGQPMAACIEEILFQPEASGDYIT